MYPSDMPTSDEENLERLPQDNETPAAPPQPGNTTDDNSAPLADDYPQKDTNLDSAEVYDVGTDAASGVSVPIQSDVISYNPKETETDQESDSITRS